MPEQGHMQPPEASLPWLERCQRLLGDAPTDSREMLAWKACSGWGCCPRPASSINRLTWRASWGFHIESVLHARHTEYVCIGYAAQLNWHSILTRSGKLQT
jgi:hypothetical protein